MFDNINASTKESELYQTLPYHAAAPKPAAGAFPGIQSCPSR